jgi:hypothetical protein
MSPSKRKKYSVSFDATRLNELKCKLLVVSIFGSSSNSNKSPTRCNSFSSLLSKRLFTAQHVSAVLTPIIGSSTTAVAASGFTFGAW